MFVRIASHAFVAALCFSFSGCTNLTAGEHPTATDWQVQHCPITVSGSCRGYFPHSVSGWYLSVNSAGEAELTLEDAKDTRRRFQVSPEQQRAFQKAILDEKFFDLPNDFGDWIVDGGVRTLTVCVGQMTKTIQVGSLMNGGKGDPAKLREAAHALRVLMLVRSWFSDPNAVDLTNEDQEVLVAAGQ